MGCSHYLRQATRTNIASTKIMEEAMTNVPITRSDRPEIGTPGVAVIEASIKKQEPELAVPSPGGVLKELALTQWSSLTTRVSLSLQMTLERERHTEGKTRPCLVCKTPFESEWSGERVCRRCKSGKIWRSGVATQRSR
jgi:hypothetical protein